MQILYSLGLISAVCLLSEWISLRLPFAFPAGVIAMLVLLVLLLCRALRPEHLQPTSSFLTGTMALYFVPAGVDILQSYPLIADKLLPLLAVLVFTTILTFAVTAGATSLLLKLTRGKEGGRA